MNIDPELQKNDELPDSMSLVIRDWIAPIQKAIPDCMRNSQAWKSLICQAVGTGRDKEQERLQIILKWLHEIVFPQLLPIAKESRFGNEWEAVLKQEIDSSGITASAASTAAYFAIIYYDDYADKYARMIRAANDSIYAADVTPATRTAVAAVDLLSAINSHSSIFGESLIEKAKKNQSSWEAVDLYGILQSLIEVTLPFQVQARRQ